MHQQYPPFSLECVTNIVRIVRARAIAEERALFAKCVYELVGAGLAMSVGEPSDGPFAGSNEVLESTKVEELEDCRAALSEAQGQVESFGAAVDEKVGLDPATLALLLQIGMKLLEAIIARRKNRP